MEAALVSPLGRTQLGAGTARIGRAPDNLLVVNDPEVSSHHAEIAASADGSGYFLTDLNSRNGTFVNEQRLPAHTPRPLAGGDVIRVGNTRFTFEVVGGYAPTVQVTPPSYNPTVLAGSHAGGPGPAPYNPTVLAGPGDSTPYDSTMRAPENAELGPGGMPGYASSTPQAQPSAYSYQSAQPAYPQPGYPQVQPGYPQVQPGYPQVQPGYPQVQPGYAQYPQYRQAAPPKKGGAGLWIALVVVVLLVAGVGGVIFITRSTPEKTLQTFCTALQKGDAQGMYDQYSQRMQAKTSVAKLQQTLEFIQTAGGGVESCTFSNVQQTGSTATASVSLIFKKPGIPSSPGKAFLVEEGGKWKIDSPPNQNQGL